MDTVKGTALGLGVVGLVLGGVIGYAVAETGSDEVVETTTVSTPQQIIDSGVSEEASDLRAELRSALGEHVTLATSTLIAAYDSGIESDQYTAAFNELDGNSEAVADVIGQVFPEERDSFLALWREHIGYFADYTVSVKAGDQAGIDQALEDLAGYAGESSEFFGTNLEALSPEDVQPLLVEHRDLVVDTINAYDESDYVTFYASESEAYNQIQTDIADALADAISSQFLAN